MVRRRRTLGVTACGILRLRVVFWLNIACTPVGTRAAEPQRMCLPLATGHEIEEGSRHDEYESRREPSFMAAEFQIRVGCDSHHLGESISAFTGIFTVWHQTSHTGNIREGNIHVRKDHTPLVSHQVLVEMSRC
ncbi:hypothetical protein GGR56DRAFT_591677 [Xylariaceae sp. FL0804]|nr:hypothetical protein GGR56DRAFT_591677 [Xylariaceae sp. FL0804]